LRLAAILAAEGALTCDAAAQRFSGGVGVVFASLVRGRGGEDPLWVSRLEIRVLGGFEVSVDGRRVPARAWQQRRASELVKLLALAPRQRLQREQVIDALWPDLSPDAGAANLRKAAHYARAALGSKEAVVLRGGQVSLWPDAELAVDVERFETEGWLALRAGVAEACAAVAAGYRGELLPD
jgi:DNA-binding SARP family transcriptional activator